MGYEIPNSMSTYTLYHIRSVRPAMRETTALGAAIAACCAEGVDLCRLEDIEKTALNTADTFTPTITQEGGTDGSTYFVFCGKIIQYIYDGAKILCP